MPYWIMVLVAALVTGLFLFSESRKRGLSLSWLDLFLIIQGIMLFGYVMSRAATILEEYLRSGTLTPVSQWIKHSFHWYGAVFGVAICWFATILFFSKARKRQYLTFFNVLGLSACLMLIFGKLGCFLDGHFGCGGTATSLPWGVTYYWGSAISETPMHPLQIYDMLVAAAMFILIKRYVPFSFWTAAFLILQSIWQLFAETMSPLDHLIFGQYTLAQAVYCAILFIGISGASVIRFNIYFSLKPVA